MAVSGSFRPTGAWLCGKLQLLRFRFCACRFRTNVPGPFFAVGAHTARPRAGLENPDISVGATLAVARSPGRLMAGIQKYRPSGTYAVGAHSVRPRAAGVVGPYGKMGEFPITFS